MIEMIIPTLENQIPFPTDHEIGGNIYMDGTFDINHGTAKQVIMHNPLDKEIFGSFHTHPKGIDFFSIGDVKVAIESKEQIMLLGCEDSLIMFDMRTISDMIEDYNILCEVPSDLSFLDVVYRRNDREELFHKIYWYIREHQQYIRGKPLCQTTKQT